MTDRTLQVISRDLKEAIILVDLIASVLAKAAYYSPQSLTMAADYIESPSFGGEDEERALITAITQRLRESAADAR
jgi:hypothetical protein